MFWEIVVVAGYVLSWGMVPVVLRANKPPVSTLNWIWVCLFMPWVGPFAYFLFGSTHLARKHLTKSAEIDAVEAARLPTDTILPRVADLLTTRTAGERDFITLLSNVTFAVPSGVAEVELLVDAPAFYPALLAAVRAARHHVHVEFYIFRNDQYGRELVAALAEAAGRGVEVRLLCDKLGCFGTPRRLFNPLTDAGGRFAWFRTVNPLQNRWIFNLRNHRKLQIIDGETAFVGGMNVGREHMGEDPACGPWRDVQVRLRGQIAAALQRVFADDWYYASDEKLTDDAYYPVSAAPPRHVAQVLADGPDNNADPIQMSIVAQLNAARERAWLTAGYFVPNEPLLTALKLSASRGVDTRLLISAKSDHPWLVQVGRSYYEELLDYGVKIYEYSRGTNHAKVAAFDGRWMMVGSANFDIRSMRLNFELNVLVDDAETTAKLEDALRHDYEQASEQIDPEAFRRRPFTQRCLESLFRPLAPLL